MNTILIKNGIIITLGENPKVLYNHSILIEGDKVKKIDETKSFTGKYEKVIDAHGKVVHGAFFLQFVKDTLDHGRCEFFGGEAKTPADNDR